MLLCLNHSLNTSLIGIRFALPLGRKNHRLRKAYAFRFSNFIFSKNIFFCINIAYLILIYSHNLIILCRFSLHKYWSDAFQHKKKFRELSFSIGFDEPESVRLWIRFSWNNEKPPNEISYRYSKFPKLLSEYLNIIFHVTFFLLSNLERFAYFQ